MVLGATLWIWLIQRWFEHQQVRVSPSRMTSLRDGVEGRIEDAEDAKISFVKEMKRWRLRIRFGDGLGFITYIVITSVVIIIYNILCIMLCIHILYRIVQREWKGRLPGSQPLVLWKTSNIQIRSCLPLWTHLFANRPSHPQNYQHGNRR